MKRVLAVLAVVVMLSLAGCADGTFTETGDDINDDPDTPTVVDDEDEDSDDTASNETDSGESSDEMESNESTGVDPPSNEGELEIHHIDVGQADAALILTPANETVLIDTGHWQDNGETVLEYLNDQDVDRIDHLVATHAHADHIGGHAEVIDHYETERDGIDAIYDSGVPHDTLTYDDYLDAVETHNKELLVVEEGDELPLDGAVNATVVNPATEDSGNDLHYNSIAIMFEYHDTTYLTTGDAETEAETRMTSKWGDELESDVYQAGHHGSSTSSTDPFMDAVDPDVAVISSAYDSQYGHPHDEVLETFADRNIETYWTGVHDDVVVTLTGDDVTVEAATNASTDPETLMEKKPSDNDTDDESHAITEPIMPGAITASPIVNAVG